MSCRILYIKGSRSSVFALIRTVGNFNIAMQSPGLLFLKDERSVKLDFEILKGRAHLVGGAKSAIVLAVGR